MGMWEKTQTTLLQKLVKYSIIRHDALTKRNLMHIQTRLEPEILEAAKQAAALEGTSLSQYLRKLVQQDLESRHGDDGDPRQAGINEGDADPIR
jgi:predicted DNA binding CopG/RHH family protein